MSEGKNRCTICGETLVLDGLNKIVNDLIVELAGLSHTELSDIGVYTHPDIDLHIDDETIHFEQMEIDHVNLLNKGVKTHAEIDTHVDNAAIHFERDVVSGQCTQVVDFIYAYTECCWKVLNTNITAMIVFKFRCPETRDDWKIKISYGNDTSSVIGSGKLTVKRHGVAQYPSVIINNINFDLTINTFTPHRLDKVTDNFTVPKGDIVYVIWNKDTNEGVGNLLIYDVILTTLGVV